MKKPLQTGMTIPVFPLPTTVFYPGTPLPLHIFEPRYRQMTSDVLEGERKIGMVLLKPNWEENYFGKPQVYSVGCVGKIEKEIKHPDGKYNFTLVGLRRFRIVSEKQGKLYRQAEIKLLAVSRPHIIVEDYNGNFRLVGKDHGAELTTGNFSNGAAMGDLYGYSLTFVSQETEAPDFVTTAAYNAESQGTQIDVN